ncbi:membrane protein [Caballeronia peredens]|nr:membrane protein [Caballeronia peredens]
MKARIKLSLGMFLSMSFGVASHAQQQTPPVQPTVQPAVPRGLTKEQQAALDKQDQEIAQVAQNIVKFLDQDKAAEVWDGASPVAKRIISRDAFVQKVAHDRAILGAPGMRMPMGIRHYRYDGTGNLPAGAYINVMFDTQFAQAKGSALEMVTFYLDADNIWRFVGYSVH